MNRLGHLHQWILMNHLKFLCLALQRCFEPCYVGDIQTPDVSTPKRARPRRRKPSIQRERKTIIMNLQSLDPSNPFHMFDVNKVCATCTSYLLQGRSYSLDTMVDEAANVDLYHVLESQFQFKCKENGQSNICRQCFSKTLLLYDFHQQCTKSAILFNKYVEYQEQLTTLDTDLHIFDTHAKSTDTDEEQEQKLTIEGEVIYTRDDSTMVKTEDECKVLDEQKSFDTNMSCNIVASDCEIIPLDSEFSQKYNKTKPQTRTSSRLREKETQSYKEYADAQGHDAKNQQIIEKDAKKKKQYKCSICHAGFHCWNRFMYHKNIHMKRFVCSYCGKAIGSFCDLKKHEKTQTRERPFECRQCGKGYISNYLLQQHLATHSKLRPFKCGVCKKVFKNNSALWNHKLIHSGRRYMCNKCGSSYTRAFNLKRHVLTHEGEKD